MQPIRPLLNWCHAVTEARLNHSPLTILKRCNAAQVFVPRSTKLIGRSKSFWQA